MVKAAKQASRRPSGGYSERRVEGDVTPKGKARYAPRWSTAGAIAFARGLAEFIAKCNNPAENKQQGIRMCLEDKNCLEQVLRSAHINKATQETRTLVREIMEVHHEAVQKEPAKVEQKASQIRARVYMHTGPMEEATEPAQEEAQTGEAAADGWWLDKEGEEFHSPRPVPAQESVMRLEMETWGLGRVQILPHDIIVYERAHGRVVAWRKKNGRGAGSKPPVSLAASLVHSSVVPTALANKGDHFWLPFHGRWVSPTELLRLFGVPDDSSLTRGIKDPSFGLNAIAINNALGRAVKIAEVRRALAAANLDRTARLRYGSACSGIDLFAVEIEAQWQDWTYVRASEKREEIAKALQKTYAHRGLQAGGVDDDATVMRDAAQCDLWVATPPCEKFSTRNHGATSDDRLDAAIDIQDMMWYPRVMRPQAIIVENVDEPGARESIDAALFSLPGYSWTQFATGEPEAGEMRRKRRFWIGKRV